MVDELIANGHNVSILTGMYPDFDTNNVEILYFGNKNNINIVSNLEKNQNKLLPEMQLKNILWSFEKIYRFFINYLAWPDYSMFWLYQIYKNRNKISRITMS